MTMNTSLKTIFHHIEIADPKTADLFFLALKTKPEDLPLKEARILVDQIIRALSIELSFGREVAKAYAVLINKNNLQYLELFKHAVRRAGKNGAALGLLMARHFPGVLCADIPSMVQQFNSTIDVMLKKGVYTLKPPLETLSHIIAARDYDAAFAFLELLTSTYAKDLSYNRTIYLTRVIPKAAKTFSPRKRGFQIKQLKRVMDRDHHLADPFLEGMEKGLDLLGEKQLGHFIHMGIDRFDKQPDLGIKFLSLSSASGIDACAMFQVTAPLLPELPQLNQYLKARTGRRVSVRPVSATGEKVPGGSRASKAVCCDSVSIYLPDEIDLFDTFEDNRSLFKVLLKLEAGLIEFKTFAFDIEQLFDFFPASKHHTPAGKRLIKGLKALSSDELPCISDLEIFFSLFQNHRLAKDLFIIFEHARIIFHTKKRYPGMHRQIRIFHDKAAKDPSFLGRHQGFLFPVYASMAMGLSNNLSWAPTHAQAQRCFSRMASGFCKMMPVHSSVEACALLVMEFYDEVKNLVDAAVFEENERFHEPYLTVPFGRRLRPDLAYAADLKLEAASRNIWRELKKNNVQVYRSELKETLKGRLDQVTKADIARLAAVHPFQSKDRPDVKREITDLSWLGLDNILERNNAVDVLDNKRSDKVYWYKEWDLHTGEYLVNHARVREYKAIFEDREFYLETLSRYQGLVKKIKYAFELLKPEGLTLLRQWSEGDEFDHRALIDFCVDKKAGLMPSDRLYIKRIKQQRDVAVLLLVDVSRSTANPVAGTGSMVLDVEKEALVLFCEALTVVGDAFAIAGFSGTGPLGVDYYIIKDFHDRLEKETMGRISALSPKRSTRMGAAIRHAAHGLNQYPAKKRLLIIIGDGFPNDLNYKGLYAIEDTRRAIMEARAKSIHVKAVTVNMNADNRLDSLYGHIHHHVISNVRELPDRLLRVYSAMTRH